MRGKPPRVPSRVAVDPRWTRLCACQHGDAWRGIPGAPVHCLGCGGILKPAPVVVWGSEGQGMSFRALKLARKERRKKP